MGRAEIAGQVKTVEVARGLFIIGYVSADDAFEPPIVTFSLDPSQEQDAEFLLDPDTDEPILCQPGTALIMRTVRPVKMQVVVTPRRQDGSIAANVKVERLTQGEPIDAPEAAETFDFTGLQLMGHVAGLGDVFANLNQWIAGPSAPSRVEGIAVEWPNKPAHFDIRYSVKLGRPGTTPSRMMDMGSFAGTRGKAIPLTGVAFELSGEASCDYQLCAEAGFLASPIMRVIGRRVVLSGPSGREPLVGLRLNLELADTERARGQSRGSLLPTQPSPATVHQFAEPSALASGPRPKESGPTGVESMAVEPMLQLANSDFAGEARRGSASPPQPSPATVHPSTEPPALKSGPRFSSGPKESTPTGMDPMVEPMNLELANNDLAGEARRRSASPPQPSPATVHPSTEPPALSSRVRVFRSRPKEGGPTGGEPLVEPPTNLEFANSDLPGEAISGSPPPSQPSPATARQSVEPPAPANRVRVFRSRPKEG